MIQKNALVLIIAAMVALAVFSASAAAETMNISVTEPNQYFSTPQNISVPKNATKLIISADTTDIQIDIHLYDPFGNHTGALYPIGEETEIPNSTYSGWDTDPEVITVTNPAAGNYTLKAYGFFATGWANCTITISTAPPVGNLSHLTGQVQGQMLNGSVIPLPDVNITVAYSANNTLYNTFLYATNDTGYFSIDLPSNTTFDVKFSKTGFEDYTEERVKTLNPCETKDLGVVYLTEKRVPVRELEVTAVPSQVCNDTDSSVTVTVTDNKTGAPVSGATVTLSGCGVSEGGTTDSNGKVSFTIHPTSAPCDILVRATKTGYKEGETTIHVEPCRIYGTLIVDVIDRVTGKNVGTFNVPDTGGVGSWPVPEVEVTAWDSSTKTFITSNMTRNGTAILIIPIPTGDRIVVDVNNTPVTAGCNLTHSFPGVTKGSEMGITVIANKTKPVTLEVTVINPPPPSTLKLHVDVTPREAEICTDTDITVSVTDNKTGAPVSGATVTLSGCGVSEGGTTDSNGKVSFTIHPTALGNITVTASKAGYVGDATTINAIDRVILLIHVYDATNSSKIPENATVTLMGQMATWWTKHSDADDGKVDGIITFNASDIDCKEDWYTIVASASPPSDAPFFYREYIEHGIWLPVEGYKEKEAPLPRVKK